MTNLYIAESILDSKEFININAASASAVEQYAFGALDICIRVEDAQLIYETIRSWLGRNISSSFDYHYEVTAILSETALVA